MLAHKKSGNKANMKKIQDIALELTETPYAGTGKPEALKHDYQGYWSRRINKKDRLIYQVDEDQLSVKIISVKDHYPDK